MPTDLHPLRVLLLTLSGFVIRHQAGVIAYLVEQYRILRVPFTPSWGAGV